MFESEPSRRKFSPDLKEWESDLNICEPINTEDILGFKAWINWHGYSYTPGALSAHPAFDFSAYLREDNSAVIGLPEDLEIHAVADGIVDFSGTEYDIPDYYRGCVVLAHGDRWEDTLRSTYYHITPKVKSGDVIKKGDTIGTLYKAPGNERGPLVHLHFELLDTWEKSAERWKGILCRWVGLEGMFMRYRDPIEMFGDTIGKYTAMPEHELDFKVQGLDLKGIEIAHFKELDYSLKI